ncbi:MAG: D-tyrosyl-tRNA(Tyr) deacylase [Bacteroidales bacterium]|jgi:D-tyrosyl-tRNA(Tyr) deacylase|nr:D-tyrosyl-tRNA(Tyr) deacylase [Bacteroidales bacterium]
MRTVIQRVKRASVSIDNEVHSSIEGGMLIFLGIEENDTPDDMEWMCKKIAHLRIFDDERKIMNLSLSDIHGSCLVVSQFTLYASTKKGSRPSYFRAAMPDTAIPFYEKFVKILEGETQLPVESGVFGADMQIELLNDGPVTIIIDSKYRE